MRGGGLRVGELAKRTGLTVRTLHWYDQIGLLSPSAHTEAGHRLYTERDIARLQQIVSLRQFGLSLDEIRDALDRPDCSLARVLELHAARLRAQLEVQRTLCARLEALVAGLRATGNVSVDDLVQTMEMIEMTKQYYTPEQLAQIEARGQALGDAGLRRAEAEWVELIASVKAEMAAGTDPTDPRVRALAARWQGLVRGFTGGDPGIERSLQRMWSEETTIHGYDTREMRQLGEYIDRAMKAT